VDLGLAGRTAVVTGASRGIGLAITRALVEEGVTVVAAARSGSQSLDELGDAVHVVQVDLSTPDGPATLIAAAVEALGGIDVLVNNVGAVHPRLGGFLSVSDDEWAATLDLDVLAAIRTMRAAIPHLTGRDGANIVTVSSVNAFLPDPGVLDYSAAKAALSNVCKSLSKELGPAIRVNTVSPGPVATDLWLGAGGVAATVGGAGGRSADEVVRAQEAAAPSGRFTTPQEVADAVVFLASPRSANTTGADLVIDGGLIPTL